MMVRAELLIFQAERLHPRTESPLQLHLHEQAGNFIRLNTQVFKALLLRGMTVGFHEQRQDEVRRGFRIAP